MLADDGDKHIDRDCNPELGLHRVLADAKEGLDPQVLFDPFEEQFYLPATLIDLSNGKRRKHEVIREELQPIVGHGVHVCDSADRVALVRQAVNAFKAHLPSSAPVNLVTEK